MAPEIFNRLAPGGSYTVGHYTDDRGSILPEDDITVRESFLADRFRSNRLLYRPGVEIYPGVKLQSSEHQNEHSYHFVKK